MARVAHRITFEAPELKRIIRKYERMGGRAQNLAPVMPLIIKIMEAEERRLFVRLRGRYVRTGALRASLTQTSAPGAIRKFHNLGLEFGSSLPHARYARKKSGESAVLVHPMSQGRTWGRRVMDYLSRGLDEE